MKCERENYEVNWKFFKAVIQMMESIRSVHGEKCSNEVSTSKQKHLLIISPEVEGDHA